MGLADLTYQGNATKPLLIVLSGPSGVGKDLLLSHMKASSDTQRHFTITATTRPKRSGEQDGVDYFFVSKQQFEEMIGNGELLECAKVYGNYYGVPKAQITDALRSGKDVIMKIDVQGAATIRRITPNALYIFLAPPSEDELKRRLTARRTESTDTLAVRLQDMRQEMKEAAKFDYTVVHHTNKTDDAVLEVEAIIQRERRRS